MKKRILPRPSVLLRRFFQLAFHFVLLLSVNACGWLAGPPQSDMQADALYHKWGAQNEQLEQAKGFIRIRMRISGRQIAGRAVWAAIFPDRLRIELLSFLGQPIMKFAANGQDILVRVSGEDEPYRIKQKPGALERIIHMPMGVEDLLKILRGCPPETPFAAARMRRGDTNDDRVVLLNRWHQPVALITAKNAGPVKEMESFDADGRMSYRIIWKRWVKKQGYAIPKEIEVITGKGDRLSLEVDRLFPDVPVSDALFELEDAGAS